MSKPELADAITTFVWERFRKRPNVDAHAISRYERGKVRWPREPIRVALRTILCVTTDADLGFFPPPETRGVKPKTVARSKAVDRVDAVLAGAADQSAELLARAETTNVGELTIEQLHADVSRIAHTYLTKPTLPLFARMCALRDRAFHLLDGRHRPAQARDLWATAGWSLTMLAWMTIDMGGADIAETHARVAWACADNADHDGVRAWVHATRHTAAYWQGDCKEAARHAAAGMTYATGTAATFLASAYALDLARIGHAEQAREALITARRTAEEATPAPDEIGGPLTCTIARAEGIWADTLLTLGDPAAAAEHATLALARFEATPDGQRNRGSERMARLQLVKARLASRELDGAIEAFKPILAIPPEQRAQPLLARLAEVKAATTEYGDSPLARKLRDGIAALTA
jgi:hypothetical protein